MAFMTRSLCRRLRQTHTLSSRKLHSSVTACSFGIHEFSFTEAPLVSISEAADQVFSLVLDIRDIPALRHSHTRPGQHVQLRVGHSKPVFMSIASPPATAASGYLEFLVKYVKGQTAGLLCNLNTGDAVGVSPVSGNGFPIELILPPERFPNIFLFATGTGISPIRSLIEGGLDASRRSNTQLYYGARNRKSMAYEDKFKEWEALGVKVVPVFSQSEENSTGEPGYVQASLIKAQNAFDPHYTGAVLSGQKGMIQDVTSYLVSKGVPQERIMTNFGY